MNSRTRPSFWRTYAALSAAQQEAARRAYRLFLKIPRIRRYASRNLGGYDHVWSVRVSEQYRDVGERQGDTIWWAWVGTHNEFDKLFR